MAIGTAALIVVLSVYNGFDGMIRENLRATDPDYLVRPSEGKTFSCYTEEFSRLADLEGVSATVAVLEETVAVRYRGGQSIARLRGLENSWDCSVSSTLAKELGIHTAFFDRMEIYFPSKSEQFSISNPQASLERIQTSPKNIVDLEGNVVIVPIQQARELLHQEGMVTGFEIWCDTGKVPAAKEIKAILGDGFEVLDRVQQQPALYKMMRYEKAAIFLILLFIVLIVAFNIYGSLSMLIIEKRQDRETLRSLGASPKLIRRIFADNGWMVSGAGMAVGLAAGILLVLAQAYFGLVRMPGNSLVQFYPVELRFTDILLTLGGVMLIGAAITGISLKNIDKDEDN